MGFKKIVEKYIVDFLLIIYAWALKALSLMNLLVQSHMIILANCEEFVNQWALT